MLKRKLHPAFAFVVVIVVAGASFGFSNSQAEHRTDTPINRISVDACLRCHKGPTALKYMQEKMGKSAASQSAVIQELARRCSSSAAK